MAHVELTAKLIGTYQPKTPKKVLIDTDGAKVIKKSGTTLVQPNPHQSYEVYETPQQIQLLEDPASTNPFLQDKQTGITADATPLQGDVPLTKYLNVVATCATANDCVTLKAAAADAVQVIINNGVATLQVFPASGDAIDDGAVNASTTIAAGERATFYAVDGTYWKTISF